MANFILFFSVLNIFICLFCILNYPWKSCFKQHAIHNSCQLFCTMQLCRLYSHIWYLCCKTTSICYLWTRQLFSECRSFIVTYFCSQSFYLSENKSNWHFSKWLFYSIFQCCGNISSFPCFVCQDFLSVQMREQSSDSITLHLHKVMLLSIFKTMALRELDQYKVLCSGRERKYQYAKCFPLEK